MTQRVGFGEPPGLPTIPAPPKGRLAEEGSGIIGLFFGLALTAVFLVGSADEPTGFERIFSVLAFGGLVSVPGVLAMLGRRRPVLYLAAAVLGIPLAMISMAGAAFPLLVPAVMAMIAYARRAPESVPRMAPPVIAMLAFTLGIASFFVMIFHEDPVCRSIENGVTCSSDVVTTFEALASMTISTLAVVLPWLLARPRQG